MKRTIKRRVEITIETCEIKTIHIRGAASGGVSEDAAQTTSIVEMPSVSAEPRPESGQDGREAVKEVTIAMTQSTES